MEKENTTKTGGEGKEGFSWEGCKCGCGDMPIQEEKSKTFMDYCGSMCKPEEMSKMLKDCCGNMSIPEAMKEKVKGFYRGKSRNA